MGISIKTIPPTKPCTIPLTLIFAFSVPIGSITKGPDRKKEIADNSKIKGPTIDLLLSLKSLRTFRENIKSNDPKIIKFII